MGLTAHLEGNTLVGMLIFLLVALNGDPKTTTGHLTHQRMTTVSAGRIWLMKLIVCSSGWWQIARIWSNGCFLASTCVIGCVCGVLWTCFFFSFFVFDWERLWLRVSPATNGEISTHQTLASSAFRS